LAFAFGCSSGGGNDPDGGAQLSSSSNVSVSSSSSVQSSSSNSSSSSVGSNSSSSANEQGGSFNENSQVYNLDGRNIGTAYKGSGIIKIVVRGNGDGNSLNAGSVTNGIVKLELPTIPEEYLSNNYWCKNSPKDAKYSDSYLELYNNETSIGRLSVGYLGNDYVYFIDFLYSSKAAKISCENTDIDAKAGWNKVYFKRNGEEYQVSTNDFLKKAGEMKWILEILDDDR